MSVLFSPVAGITNPSRARCATSSSLMCYCRKCTGGVIVVDARYQKIHHFRSHVSNHRGKPIHVALEIVYFCYHHRKRTRKNQCLLLTTVVAVSTNAHVQVHRRTFNPQQLRECNSGCRCRFSQQQRLLNKIPSKRLVGCDLNVICNLAQTKLDKGVLYEARQCFIICPQLSLWITQKPTGLAHVSISTNRRGASSYKLTFFHPVNYDARKKRVALPMAFKDCLYRPF